MNKNSEKSNLMPITIRISKEEKAMVKTIKEVEGFKSQAAVFRFLLRQRYELRYKHVGGEEKA
ncbi:MAG: hypothetical protein QNJ65_21990 [Xenococcaceae cyanobacterium MO_234.B1]|nr:hypothetical protein [Xenococcaceae cyanobacterium MO_234.B1]